jgi:hypothetical protein
MFSLNIPVNIDFFEIADRLDHDEALELTKLIDSQQVNYEFTEEIAFFLLNEAIKCLDEGSEVEAFKRSVNDLLNKYK